MMLAAGCAAALRYRKRSKKSLSDRDKLREFSGISGGGESYAGGVEIEIIPTTHNATFDPYDKRSPTGMVVGNEGDFEAASAVI